MGRYQTARSSLNPHVYECVRLDNAVLSKLNVQFEEAGYGFVGQFVQVDDFSINLIRALRDGTGVRIECRRIIGKSRHVHATDLTQQIAHTCRLLSIDLVGSTEPIHHRNNQLHRPRAVQIHLLVVGALEGERGRVHRLYFIVQRVHILGARREFDLLQFHGPRL